MIIVEWPDDTSLRAASQRGRVLGWCPNGEGKVCGVVLVGMGLVDVPLSALTVVDDSGKAARRLARREKRAARKAGKLAAAAEIERVINGARGG